MNEKRGDEMGDISHRCGSLYHDLFHSTNILGPIDATNAIQNTKLVEKKATDLRKDAVQQASHFLVRATLGPNE